MGDLASIPGSGRSPGEGNGNPLQYSCLENPMDRGAWQATVHGVARVNHALVIKPPPVVKNPPGNAGHARDTFGLLTQVWSLSQEYCLEKGMATHSSVFAWRIPWAEEPGGLQSMGSQESDTT